MNDYREPGQSQEYNDETRESNPDTDISQGKTTLEKNGPDKRNLHVLNEDGSLADLPDQNVPGRGALDGTIAQ